MAPLKMASSKNVLYVKSQKSLLDFLHPPYLYSIQGGTEIDLNISMNILRIYYDSIFLVNNVTMAICPFTYLNSTNSTFLV